MTVVVAGYDPSPWGLSRKQPLDVQLTDAFVYSDSRLSRGEGSTRRVVTDAAPKIDRIAVRIGIPVFTPAGTSTRRVTPGYEWSCGIAYAGNEFLGNAVLSAFSKTAGSLVYTWCGADVCVPGHYDICTENSPDAVANSDSFFDRSIDFDHSELPKLTGDLLASLLQRDFQKAIDDILRNEQSNGRLDAYLRTEVVLIAGCQGDQNSKIYVLKIRRDETPDPPWLRADVQLVVPTDLVVLGQASWKNELVQVMREARSTTFIAGDAIAKRLKELITNAEAESFVGGRLQAGTATVRDGFDLER